MRRAIALSLLSLIALACTSVEEDAEHAHGPHGHDDHTYPATPAEPPVPLKNAEYPGARFRQARFFTRGRRQAIDRIIIHTTEGRYEGTLSWFRDPNNPYRTSAHYVIRSSDGEITQMVREADTAHHERTHNARSIGIEHEAFVAQSRWYTDAMYRSSAALVRHLCRKYNIPMDRAHIRGHNETDPGRRSDPGRHWDWDRFMRLVRDGADPAPAPGAQPPADAACEGNLWRCDFARTGRERCQAGRVVDREACPAGCQVMPVGRDDVCRPSAGPGQDWGACTAEGQPGTCMAVSDCRGYPVPGFCPGDRNVQCCTRADIPEEAPAAPPAPSVSGRACRVDGAAGQCLDLADAARCQAPAGLVYHATCGDAGACCVALDPAAPPPPPPPPDPAPPPAQPAPGGNPGAACDVWGTPGRCLTPADARTRCAQAHHALYIHPTCGAQHEALCCIETAPASDPVRDPVWQDAPECSISGERGLCVPTATCRGDGGYPTPGYCPGPNDIQCCRWR